MNYPHFATVLFLVATAPLQRASLTAAAEMSSALTPPETVSQFFAALAEADIDRAVALTAPLNGVPDDAVRQEYAELSEFAKAATPRVIAHLQLEDAAVVIFHESGKEKSTIIDLDPAFLVRRDSKWYVLFKLTRYDRPYHQLDTTTQARLKKLGDWFDSQKPQLQRILSGA